MRAGQVMPDGIWDRTHHVPLHKGQYVLPNTPILTQMLHHALKPGRLAIRDLNSGVEKTYAQLLTDVLYLRNYIETKLPPLTKKALDDGEEVYIGVLAAGGYEYVVAFFAVLALRAAIVPMSKNAFANTERTCNQNVRKTADFIDRRRVTSRRSFIFCSGLTASLDIAFK